MAGCRLSASQTQKNVAITGEGTIDGQGAVWWERWRENIRATGKKGNTDRPRLIYIKRSSNVLVDGVTLAHSPRLHVVMRDSRDVDVNGTRMLSPWHAPNTDAIKPIDRQNIRITNNYIDCNDDHIAIKAEKQDSRFPDGVVDNIYIANNTLKQGRGISIGSESAGGFTLGERIYRPPQRPHGGRRDGAVPRGQRRQSQIHYGSAPDSCAQNRTRTGSPSRPTGRCSATI